MDAPSPTATYPRIDPTEDIHYDITFVETKEGWHTTTRCWLISDPHERMEPRLSAKVLVPRAAIKEPHRRQVLIRAAVIAHLAKDFDQINGEGDWMHYHEDGFPPELKALRVSLGLEAPQSGAN